jgi:hypothetical protein
MIIRSYDADILRSIGPEFLKEEFLPVWLGNPHNVILVEDDNIGLCTFEYPGLYTLHWFFKARGRDAIKLGRRMVREVFEKYAAEAVRGFTPVENGAARWATRQVGLESLGIVQDYDGREHELFFTTKQDFMERGNS